MLTVLDLPSHSTYSGVAAGPPMLRLLLRHHMLLLLLLQHKLLLLHMHHKNIPA